MLIIFFVTGVISCKKNVEPEEENRSCALFVSVSSDTNFIPHKKNNYWDYCYEQNHAVGNNSVVIFDSIVNNAIQFKIKNTKSSKNGTQIRYLNYTVDAQNNFYCSESYFDTIPFIQANSIKLIDPSANNGDTIFNNQIAGIKVILINKNETYKSIVGCYHSLEIRPNSNNSNYFELLDHYYKKGIGEIFSGFNSTYLNNGNGYVLENAIIH